jgi:hypothetical protein
MILSKDDLLQILNLAHHLINYSLFNPLHTPQLSVIIEP